ncbi:MAG: GT2 family glycosyltransferase [Candidatus Aldehydirespiratoraceae bacterium]
MRVVVVIVTYNSAADLPPLLASVPESIPGHDLQVVIVDSGSTDASVAIAESARSGVVTVALGANVGYGAGVNAGWAAADRPDAMVLLNPDLTVNPGAFEPWLEALSADGGVVAPRITNPSGELEPSLRRRPSVARAFVEGTVGGRIAGRLKLGELINDPIVYDHPATAPWVSGAALAVSAECMTEVGPWEERFFLYSEETDFCLRAGTSGFRVGFTPDAGVVHRGGDFEVSKPLYSLLTWNRVRLIRAQHGRSRGAAMKIVVSIGEAIRSFAGANAAVHRSALASLWSSSQRAATVPPESHLDWNGAR